MGPVHGEPGSEGTMTLKQMKLLRGTLDVLILQALSGEPAHGYAVVEWIRSTTNGALDIEDGALYTALHRMEKRGWLQASWGASENNRRAKYYALTLAGRRELASASEDWSRYAEAVFKVLGSSPGAS
jgi:PadR family transcriptional regulator PadR